MAARKAKRKPKKTARSAGKQGLIHGPMHPWRPCPIGEHWVREHSRNVDPSEKHPDGITIVRGHCRSNPSHRDQLYAEEMENMAREFFPRLGGAPSPGTLGFNDLGKRGDSFDDLIR